MNIYNLAVPAALLAIGLSACAPITYEAAPTTTPTIDPAVDYSCEPLLASDWSKVAVPPPLVLEAKAKSPEIATIHVDDLYVTYYRDCTSMVKSSMSARYPDGFTLGVALCNGNSMQAHITRTDETTGISPEITFQAKEVLLKLKSSDACSTKRIMPLGT